MAPKHSKMQRGDGERYGPYAKNDAMMSDKQWNDWEYYAKTTGETDDFAIVKRECVVRGVTPSIAARVIEANSNY